MKTTLFTDEQIIGFLKQCEAGMPVKYLCRSGGFGQPIFYKWRSRFGVLVRSYFISAGQVPVVSVSLGQQE